MHWFRYKKIEVSLAQATIVVSTRAFFVSNVTTLDTVCTFFQETAPLPHRNLFSIIIIIAHSRFRPPARPPSRHVR